MIEVEQSADEAHRTDDCPNALDVHTMRSPGSDQLPPQTQKSDLLAKPSTRVPQKALINQPG